MKKNKLTNLLKIGVFLLGISMSLWNCEKDNTLEEGNLIESSLKVSYVSSSTINLNTKLSQKLSSFSNSKNYFRRGDVYSSQHNFTINTDQAKYIENSDGTYHSYTFKISREEDYGFLENLLVSLQLDGSYKLFLIKYELTEEERNILIRGDFIDLVNKITSNEITDNGTVQQIFAKGSCISLEVFPCSSGGTNAHGPALQLDGVSYCSGTNTVIDTSGCGGGSAPDVSPGGSETGGTGNNESSGNGGGTGNGGVGDGGNEQFPDSSSPIDCGSGYELYNGRCVPICERNSTRNINGNCDCDQGYVNHNGNCMAEEDYYSSLLEDGFVVVSSNSADKVDPAEELECLDLTQGANLTVYVQQPNENSDAVVGANQVGHAFIGIEQGGVTRQFGYYPDKEVGLTGVGDDYTAAIKTNYDYLYHVSISKNVSSQELTSIVNYVIGFPSIYNTNSYACADFAIAIGNLGGMGLPSTTVSSFVFSGRSPGKLGQEIRAMSSTATITISTTSTNSPSREGCQN